MILVAFLCTWAGALGASWSGRRGRRWAARPGCGHGNDLGDAATQRNAFAMLKSEYVSFQAPDFAEPRTRTTPFLNMLAADTVFPWLSPMYFQTVQH